MWGPGSGLHVGSGLKEQTHSISYLDVVKGSKLGSVCPHS